jgi:protein associated with RNAse G/E
VGWEPGRLVLRRHFLRDHQLGRVWVGRVAADDDQGLWIWIEAGSPWLDVTTKDGRRLRDVPFPEFGAAEKTMAEFTWNGRLLMLHEKNTANSTWLFFAEDNTFKSWYVNLERPGTRWDDGHLCGIDTVDYDLDILVQPDRSWQWKDEDEFQDHLAHPDHYWCDDEQQVRDEGERVVKLIEASAFPFDGTRQDFQPDPDWITPAHVPPGWNRPRAW